MDEDNEQIVDPDRPHRSPIRRISYTSAGPSAPPGSASRSPVQSLGGHMSRSHQDVAGHEGSNGAATSSNGRADGGRGMPSIAHLVSPNGRAEVTQMASVSSSLPGRLRRQTPVLTSTSPISPPYQSSRSPDMMPPPPPAASKSSRASNAKKAKAASAASPPPFTSPAPVAMSAIHSSNDLDFDLPELQDSTWEAEMNAYRVRLALRMGEIEKASERCWSEQHVQVQKRLEKGYEARLSAVLRKSDERAQIQRREEEERERLRRDAARKRREREVDRELLSTLEVNSKGKAVKGKGVPPGGKGRASRGADGEGDDFDDDLTGTPRGAKDKRRRLEEAAYGAPGSARATPMQMVDDEDAMAEPMGPAETIVEPDGPPLPLDENRLAQLEDAHRRLWVSMVRKEIPKVYRVLQGVISGRSVANKRIAVVVQREAKRSQARAFKSAKDSQLRARRAMREMLLFWKRNEKEEKEMRRKAEKEAADRVRKEEEMREAKRQARKLNFLITQTELYSHFVGNKLRTSEAEESEETSGGGSKLIDPSAAKSDAPASIAPADPNAVATSSSSAAMQVDQAHGGNLKDLDFDDDDESNLRAHAARNAQEAVDAAKQKAQAFDALAAEERRKLQAAAEEADASGRRIDEKDLGKAFDSDDLNFQNPTSMGQMDLTQPKMLTCKLKDYQLKGLNWLANLYEQGINGILADEMGLGKTVQSISLMSYLAEVHDIWGPFLVIAPSSTLHNWQQEITKFTPALKALPYWGSVKDRNVLRKFWNKKHMSYNRDSPFHVLITSYQLVVTDEQYFRRVKWQYMVLDEAQAIKSSQSTRWKTLLSFNCRNRLLLTGTPVQNSMQELWALLHFIMPSLFDSHDEFSEWFSKDIEGHAENKGTLNEGQLRRLHMILKPFMLRRIKKNVQNELGDKIEIDVLCEMSARQKMLYRGLRENVSIAELMDRASNVQDEAGLKHLMNLVMQFRKVCNHPELFERADVTGPFTFGTFAQSASLTREGDLLHCPDSFSNAIEYQVPKLLVREGAYFNRPSERSRAGFDTKYLDNMFNIWREPAIAQSLKPGPDGKPIDSAFSFVPLLDTTARDVEMAFHGHSAQGTIEAIHKEQRFAEMEPYLSDRDFAASSIKPLGRVTKVIPGNSGQSPSVLPRLDEVQQTYATRSPFADPVSRVWGGKAIAPPVRVYSNDRPFVEDQERLHRDDLISNMLYGVPAPGCEDDARVDRLRQTLPDLPPRGILTNSSVDQLPAAQMQVPRINKLIIDSTKLAHLDTLLRQLKAEDHRVLIYFQMTKMIDLMEEYLIYRQYKYLRLDGSSKISDRRDMVTDWQTKPELFVFLLSTRAGGLGINLTAADTVIFFDSDWNPSNDQQAMDRAHRLGQTKQVTVYRLITKGTIDERIIKMARNKKEVQDMVVGNKTATSSSSTDTDPNAANSGLAKPQEIIGLLMDDDELADAMLRKRQAEEKALAEGRADNMRETHRKRRLNKEQRLVEGSSPLTGVRRGKGGSSTPQQQQSGVDWSLEEDEDDFFGAKPPSAPKIEEIDGTSSSVNGKGKARSGAAPASASKAGVKKSTGAPRKPSASIRKTEGDRVVDDSSLDVEAGPSSASASPKKKSRLSGPSTTADGALTGEGGEGAAAAPKKKKAPVKKPTTAAPQPQQQVADTSISSSLTDLSSSVANSSGDMSR